MLKPKTDLEAFLDIDFWREFAPIFSIGKQIDCYAFELNDEQKEKQNEKLVREGYIHLVNPGLNSPFNEIAEVFTAILSLGLPPVFSFVYDELWMLNKQLRNLIGCLLHEEYVMPADFWAYCITPGQAGWKPHRDKIAGCLFPDKRPKFLTAWIPITQAHPLNGCMYVVPADRDEEYGMENSVKGVYALPDIRALPAEPGDVLIWTQHVYHWGGHSADQHDLPPRMSVAFEYQHRDARAVRKPLLNPAVMPTFEQRLALIRNQVTLDIRQRHLHEYRQDLQQLAEKIAKRYALPDSHLTDATL